MNCSEILLYLLQAIEAVTKFSNLSFTKISQATLFELETSKEETEFFPKRVIISIVVSGDLSTDKYYFGEIKWDGENFEFLYYGEEENQKFATLLRDKIAEQGVPIKQYPKKMGETMLRYHEEAA